MKRGNRIYLFYLILFLILIILNIHSIESRAIKLINNDSEYIKVLNKLNETEWVKVTIGVTSEDIREEVIASLSEEEFKLEGRSLLGLSFSGEITKEGLDKLVNNPNIRWVNLKIPLTPGLSQSVPLINATKVWNLNYSGRGITVCIIDTGVNASHPDLQGKVLAEKCYCRLPEGANPNCCPNGNATDNNAEDYSGHGTHVTGIIASQDSTYKGVAPNK